MCGSSLHFARVMALTFFCSFCWQRVADDFLVYSKEYSTVCSGKKYSDCLSFTNSGRSDEMCLPQVVDQDGRTRRAPIRGRGDNRVIIRVLKEGRTDGRNWSAVMQVRPYLDHCNVAKMSYWGLRYTYCRNKPSFVES